MNIVFATESALPAHIVGYHNAADALGHSSFIWFKSTKSAFDMADEFKPNVVFNNNEVVDRALGKCQSLHEFKVMADSQWPKDGFDSLNFSLGQYDKKLACDICYVGNYDNEKRKIWNNWLKPLSEQYHVKIFGQTPWPTPSYLGYLNNNRVADLYRSAKVSICFDKPLSSRCLNIMGCGGNLLCNPTSMEQIESMISEYNGLVDEDEFNNNSMLVGEYSYIKQLKDILNAQT